MTRTIVDLHTEVIHRYVFELRYAFGHLYWDRCGRIVNEIISKNEEWDFGAIREGVCHLLSPRQNLNFNFGAPKLDLAQTQDAEVSNLLTTSEFAALADAFAEVVVTNLQLSIFPRIGFRAWYLYPTTSQDDAYERVQKLRVLALDTHAFGTLGRITETSCRLVFDMASQMVRVAVVPFEQIVHLPPALAEAAHKRPRDFPSDQKRVAIERLKAERVIKSYPQYGVLVDVDAFIDDPPYPEAMSVDGFITGAVAAFQRVKEAILQERTD